MAKPVTGERAPYRRIGELVRAPMHPRDCLPVVERRRRRCVRPLESAHLPGVLLRLSATRQARDKDGPHFLSVHNLSEAHVWDVAPEGTLRWRFDGLSFGVVRYRAGSRFQNLQLLMYTPIDEERVHVRFTTIIKKLASAEATDQALKATNAETKRLFEQDIPIWEGQRYQPHPVLCPEDGQLMKYRQWARQFYRTERERPW